ncbi:MAG: glycogen debranching enzyme, partial [Thermoanaerobaculia bacterium]
FLNGKGIPTPDERGEPLTDDSFYLLFNANYEPIVFTLPQSPWGERWEKVIDTNEPIPDLREHHDWNAGEQVQVEAYSVMVLRRSA